MNAILRITFICSYVQSCLDHEERMFIRLTSLLNPEMTRADEGRIYGMKNSLETPFIRYVNGTVLS